MALFIIENNYSDRIKTDLRLICPDTSLEIDSWGPELIEYQGTLSLMRGSGKVHYSQRNLATVGSELIAELVDSPIWVGIRGETFRFAVTTFSGETLHKLGGTFAKQSITEGGVTISAGQVIYDVTDCDGAGLFLEGENGDPVYTPPHVVLFHELVHAVHFSRGLSSDESGAREWTNKFCDELGLPLRRTDHQPGEDKWWCGTEEYYYPTYTGPPNEMDFSGEEPPETDVFQASPEIESGYCFVASAACGSMSNSSVRYLNNLRNETLHLACIDFAKYLHLFSEYHKMSSVIVPFMKQNEIIRDYVRVAIIDPLVEFNKLADEFPQSSIDSLPQEWQEYLRVVKNTFEDRRKTILEKIGCELIPFQNNDPQSLASHIIFIVSKILVGQDSVERYLNTLMAKEIIPLRVTLQAYKFVMQISQKLGMQPQIASRIVVVKE